jgi:hypothetical protein
MLKTTRTDGLLRCPRRGCNELLCGVRALTFHLHIHAVGAGAYACVRCGGAFESARELTRHACARRRARGTSLFFSFSPLTFRVFRARLTIELPYFFPCPFRPFFFQLVERLRSVVRGWTCLSLTSQGFGTQQPWQPQQQPPPKHYKRKDDNNYY